MSTPGISGIYAEIYTRLATDKSLFPIVPERTLQVRETLSDPNCDVPVAARLLQTDPGLSAFIMRAANSARFLTLVPPRDLESAVRRIGLAGTSQLATVYTVRSLFASPSQKLRVLLIDALHKASRVAVISYFLAGRVAAVQPGKAMLAGLLQDIGMPPVLKCLEDRPDVFDDPAKRHAAIDQLCPLVGALILKNWDFDEELIEVVRSRKLWLRDSRQVDLADVVLIARFHALIATPDFKSCPPLNEMPAFHKLALGELTPEHSLQMLEDSREELAGLERMLGGAAA